MSWDSPFAQPGSWFKGNLHTHTTQSDGDYTPDQAIAWYRDHGYDFLALTDHWVLSCGGDFAATDHFTVLGGAELHGQSYHMLALGLTALPDKALENSPAELAEVVRGLGGLPFFAHPYWLGQTAPEIAACPAILGLEVFNSVCDKMDGLGYSRVHWDQLLARGHRLLGLAVDDEHWRHGSQGQGFVMVRATRLNEASLLEAIRKGHFYASTGPRIEDLRLVAQPDGALALRVRCSPCQRITFFASGPRGHRFDAPAGEALDSAVWPLRSEQVFLRIECQDAQGRIAWSNPVFVADVLS